MNDDLTDAIHRCWGAIMSVALADDSKAIRPLFGEDDATLATDGRAVAEAMDRHNIAGGSSMLEAVTALAEYLDHGDMPEACVRAMAKQRYGALRFDLMTLTRRLAASQAASDHEADAPPATASGMTWQQARDRAEAVVAAEGNMSDRALADRIGCDRKTIRKARGESRFLTARRAEAEARRPAPDALDRRDTIGSARLDASELADTRDTRDTPDLADLIAEQERDAARERRGLA